MPSTIYAKVLRDTDVETAFVGDRLELRQFGFTSDTNSLVIRDEHGEYHIIRQYDDTDIQELIENLNGDLSAHIENNLVHITEGDREAWDNKQDAIQAGNNISIDQDGKTINAIVPEPYDDEELRTLITSESNTRAEVDAELQAQIDTFLGAIVLIGKINSANALVTQQTLTARATELGYSPLKKGYCLVDNDSDFWVYDGISAWQDIGYFDVAQATNSSLGVVKGSDGQLKIGIDILGEMSVNGLQEILNSKQDAGSGAVTAGVRLDRNADWNTHITSGFYLKQASAAAGDVPNSPPYYTAGTGDWVLFVIGGTDGWATGSNAPQSPGGTIQIARYASNSNVSLFYRSNGVAGSSNSAGWSTWTQLSFWGGLNAGTSSALRNPNTILTPGQYSNDWNTAGSLPEGLTLPFRASLLVLASDVSEIAANRQQILIEQGGNNRAWFRTSADGTWKEIGGGSGGPVSWLDITDKPAIPTAANLSNQASAFGQSANSGNLSTYARSDHYHALPSSPTVPTGANIDASPLDQTVTHGSANTYARSDHRHAIPSTMPPTSHTHSINDIDANLMSWVLTDNARGAYFNQDIDTVFGAANDRKVGFFTWNSNVANNPLGPNTLACNGLVIKNAANSLTAIITGLYDGNTFIGNRIGSTTWSWKQVVAANTLSNYLPLLGGTLTGNLALNRGIINCYGAGNNFNENIRLLPAPNGYATIYFSRDNTLSGDTAGGMGFHLLPANVGTFRIGSNINNDATTAITIKTATNDVIFEKNVYAKSQVNFGSNVDNPVGRISSSPFSYQGLMIESQSVISLNGLVKPNGGAELIKFFIETITIPSGASGGIFTIPYPQYATKANTFPLSVLNQNGQDYVLYGSGSGSGSQPPPAIVMGDAGIKVTGNNGYTWKILFGVFNYT